MNINFYLNLPSDVQAKFVALLNQIIAKVNDMATAIDNLTDKVTQLETVEASAIELLTSLKAALDAAVAAGDMSAVQALADRLGADTDNLAAAVAANTPAAPSGPSA